MTESAEDKQAQILSTDTMNLPSFEVPKGPITPEYQAFLVNEALTEESLKKMADNDPDNPSTKDYVDEKLQELNHAKRYMMGQPYDATSAQAGLNRVKGILLDRLSRENAKKDPDDAAAASNERPLIEKIISDFEENQYDK